MLYEILIIFAKIAVGAFFYTLNYSYERKNLLTKKPRLFKRQYYKSLIYLGLGGAFLGTGFLDFVNYVKTNTTYKNWLPTFMRDIDISFIFIIFLTLALVLMFRKVLLKDAENEKIYTQKWGKW